MSRYYQRLLHSNSKSWLTPVQSRRRSTEQSSSSWTTDKAVIKLGSNRIRSMVHSSDSIASQLSNASVAEVRNRAQNSGLQRLVQAYRDHGHRQATLNPLLTNEHNADRPTSDKTERRDVLPEMDLEQYGFSESDSTSLHDLHGVLSCAPDKARLSEILDRLRRNYCGPLGFEFSYLQAKEEREWFAMMAETIDEKVKLNVDEKKQLAANMLKSQVFDNFVAMKFPTVKRYSGEGAESMMAFFDRLIQDAVQYGVEQVVLCNSHRGRLNLLTTLLEYPPVNMFRKMKGMNEFPEKSGSTGDVLSHLTSSVDLRVLGVEDRLSRIVHVTMIPNPSHLEAANPVAVGKVRGRQMTLRNSVQPIDPEEVLTLQEKLKVLCLQVHGDAAVAAQGIVMETLALSQVPHYETGGSIHLIVNNQIGFTTPAERGRSSPYCSDITKMIGAPVIHVNADFPEEVVRATAVAMAYRQKFAKDVFVDLVCFRRWGHNEIDDPTITNPKMYEAIRARRSIPDCYTNTLVKENVMTTDNVTDLINGHTKFFSDEYDKLGVHEPAESNLKGYWTGFVQAKPAVTTWDTGMDTVILQHIGRKSVQIPNDFAIHPHLAKTHVQARLTKLESGAKLDWATAEALAIGSILYQGYDVRLSGQDVGRGTFSHRHAVLTDQITGEQRVPLNNIVNTQQGYFEVANSILSEEAVLGLEYGMSIENPRRLVIWEAQFGDFFNGAQIIVDAFITSGETKWLLQSGLVLLLPHGYDGAGPEHSSCRIERFLQLTDSKEDGVDGDDVNIQVAHPTTPAQYFHLIRRQVIRNFRKPLIVIAPKLLLRLPAATSDLEEFRPGTSFSPVLADRLEQTTPSNIKRVLFCSGKHYYALAKRRDEMEVKDTAIIRLEALCPFPTDELQTELKKYPKATKFVWSQEEPQNMGAWSFVQPRFLNLVGVKIEYSGRKPMAAPAVGVATLHQEEVRHILSHPFSDRS